MLRLYQPFVLLEKRQKILRPVVSHSELEPNKWDGKQLPINFRRLIGPRITLVIFTYPKGQTLSHYSLQKASSSQFARCFPRLSPGAALSCFASSDWLINVSAKLLIGRVIHLVWALYNPFTLFTRVKMFFTEDKFPKFLACCFVYFHHLFRLPNSKNYFYHFLG